MQYRSTEVYFLLMKAEEFSETPEKIDQCHVYEVEILSPFL